MKKLEMNMNMLVNILTKRNRVKVDEHTAGWD